MPERQLSDEQAAEILAKYAKGARPPHEGSISMLAKEYNVSPFTIADIVKRRTYRHLEGDSHGTKED